MWLASRIVEKTGKPFLELSEASKLLRYTPVISYNDTYRQVSRVSEEQYATYDFFSRFSLVNEVP